MTKTLRMEIAIEAMKKLMEKDFKNIGYSAYNSGKPNAAAYISDQAFLISDAMIARANEEVQDE